MFVPLYCVGSQWSCVACAQQDFEKFFYRRGSIRQRGLRRVKVIVVVNQEAIIPGRGAALRTQGPIEYRCYLLDGYGRIVWRYKFIFCSDDEAVAAARTLFRKHRSSICAFELWQDSRYICCAADPVPTDLIAHQANDVPLGRRIATWLSRALAHV